MPSVWQVGVIPARGGPSSRSNGHAFAKPADRVQPASVVTMADKQLVAVHPVDSVLAEPSKIRGRKSLYTNELRPLFVSYGVDGVLDD